MMGQIAVRVPRLENTRNFELVLLTAVTLLALALRFYRLGEWSLWIDEIFTIGRIQAHYYDLETTLRNLPPRFNWFPVSLLLTSGALRLWGVSEWSVRLVPAIIGVLSIPVLYLPIRRIFGTGVALFSALLLAVSPWHIMWSQNGRFYTTLMLLYTLALFAFYYGLERDRPAYLLAGLALFYLALSERIIAVFLLPVIAAYLVLLLIFHFPTPGGLNLRNVLILAIPVIGGLLIEAHSLLTNGYLSFLRAIDIFVGHVNISPVRLLAGIIWRIGIATVVLGSLAGFYFSLKKRRAELFVLLAAVIPVVMLLAAAPFFFTVDRYVFITLPFWFILCALLVRSLSDRLEGWEKLWSAGVLLLLIALSMGENWLYFFDQNGGRPQWREALAYVGERKSPGDPVYVTSPQVGRYYLNDTVQSVISFDANSLPFPGQPIWFVIDESTGWIPPSTQYWLDTHAQLQQIFIVRLPAKSLDIRIYLYDPATSSYGRAAE
jgi:mannosyltransferase